MVKFKYVLKYIRKYIFKFISSFLVVLFLLLPFSVSAASLNVFSGTSIKFPETQSAFESALPAFVDGCIQTGNKFEYFINDPYGEGANQSIFQVCIPFYFSSMPSDNDQFNFSFDVVVNTSEAASWLYYWAYQIYFVEDNTRVGISSSSVSISGNTVHVDCSSAPPKDVYYLVLSMKTSIAIHSYIAAFSNIKASVTPLTPEYQDNYNDFSSESSAVEEYDRVEGELIDGSNSVWGQIKTEIFDNSLLNPNSMGPLRGLFAAGDIFSFFASEPHISPLLRYSLLIGLACFILGVALFTSTRFRKK